MKAHSVLMVANALWASALSGQSFAPPLAGLVTDGNGRIQRIFGIAGNLLPAAPDPASEPALALAFTGRGGLLKTESSLVLLDAAGAETARFDAPGGGAVFGFDPSGRPALVWFPDAQQLFSVSPGGLNPLPSPSDRIAALAAGTAGEVQVASGGPALFVPGGVLSASGSTLLFQHSDGSEESIDAPAEILHLERMGDGWVLLESGGNRYAVRLSTPLQLYLIPEFTG